MRDIGCAISQRAAIMNHRRPGHTACGKSASRLIPRPRPSHDCNARELWCGCTSCESEAHHGCKVGSSLGDDLPPSNMFLSDVHLATRGCRADALLDFLQHNDAETIYLVGDIVDFWRVKRGGGLAAIP